MGTSVSPWLQRRTKASVKTRAVATTGPPSSSSASTDSTGRVLPGRVLLSFPQLNLTSSVHRITQLNSFMGAGVAQVELYRERN